jgi:rare lipoprotein A
MDLPPPSYPHTAVASWYGKVLHGRLTAWHFHGKPGERFDRTRFTCAHKTYPFGTLLRVISGNRSVVVEVTDRGPEKFDIDLSEAAAEALGIKKLGIKKVMVIPLCLNPPTKSISP